MKRSDDYKNLYESAMERAKLAGSHGWVDIVVSALETANRYRTLYLNALNEENPTW